MAQFKPIRIGDTVPLQQINPATEEIDGKIYVSQSGVVLGRSTAGGGPHEEIPFGALQGGGGSSIISITYEEAQIKIENGELIPGRFYDISGTGGADGIICVAVTTTAFNVRAAGRFGNDFNAVEFDFSANQLIYRSDLIGNTIRGAAAVAAFPWGNQNVTENTVILGIFSPTINPNVTYRNNTLFPGSIVSSDVILGDGSVLENNIIENGGMITEITGGVNCSIYGNKVGQGAKIGGGVTYGDNTQVNDNTLLSNSYLSFSLGDNSTASTNFLFPSSFMIGINLGHTINIDYNILRNAAFVSALNGGGNFITIRYNDFGQNSALTSSIFSGGQVIINNVLAPNVSLSNLENCIISQCFFNSGSSCIFNVSCSFFNLEIGVGAQISNKSNSSFADSVLKLIIAQPESNINLFSNQADSISADIPGTIDITGLTTLDCTAAWAQYRGLFNITSGNATETIGADSLLNFPTLFPFRITPAAGLTLTLTCTPAASATAGSIVGGAGTIVLSGDNGDFVELETDPTLTFVRVKNIQIYS